MGDQIKIETCEMHTGGEPLRIIVSGYPDIKGETILDKRRYCKENLDYYRKLLMHEPRGHYDMYGAILVPVDKEVDADLAVLFTHNEGYSVMCGHATIALGRYVIDKGFIKKEKLESPETVVTIQCPCGPVKAYVEYNDGMTGAVRFFSVPAFAFALDVEVDVEGIGTIKLDVSYGGTFYAILPAERVGLNVRESKVNDLSNVADKITRKLRQSFKLEHPVSPDLAFMYGTILTDGRIGNEEGKPSANICVFADKSVDRSPTGSGVTARMALQYRKKQVKVNEMCTFESVSKSKFTGKVSSETKCGDHEAVVVEISGRAFYCGSSVFTVECDDPQQPGFLLQ